MTALEDALRDSLARQAAAPPPLGDVANTVLARVAVARRRRVAGSSLAGLVLMVAGLTGILLLRTMTAQGGHGLQVAGPVAANPTPSLTSSPVSVPFDYVIGAKLYADTGGTYSLAGLAHAVYRIDSGWVYLDGGGKLVLQRTDGSQVNLPAGGSELIVSPTGTTVGVVDRGNLHLTVVALPVQGRVSAQSWSTSLPASAKVVALAGTSAVLEHRNGNAVQYQVWLAGSGDFKAAWQAVGSLDRVYGQRADHTTLVGSGLVSGRRCLLVIKISGAVLSPAGQPTCGVDFSAGADGRVSPDGRHMVLGHWSDAPKPSLVTLVDLDAMSTGASHCGPSQAEPVWTQHGFVLIDNGKVVACPAAFSLNLQPGVPDGEAFTVVPLAS